MSYNTSDSAIGVLLRSICKRLDSSEQSKQLLGLLIKEAYEKIPFDYSITVSVTEFAERYFASKLLSKYKGWKGSTPNSRKSAARARWEADEQRNRSTNERLKRLKHSQGFPGYLPLRVISNAQKIISDCLGVFDLERCLSDCRWGSGATSSLKRGTSRAEKLSNVMSTTRGAMPFMKLVIEHDPNWCEAITGHYPSGPFSLTKSFWQFTSTSRVTTVPKDWDIDRVIDMQPTANGYLQQGVGRHIRRRLRFIGIDLNSQENNQKGALRAFYDSLSTLDLKSASDSITVELVALLLPHKWFSYLNSIRTTTSSFDGAEFLLEKFSAMGNAFTFELETLIFYAITRAVAEVREVQDPTVLVYGDDIICDRDIALDVINVLEYCGFQVNTDKSFLDGPFFESCGKHYYLGSDVTPVYQKNVINSPEECIRFYNRLVRWSERIYGDPWHFDEVLLSLQSIYFLCGNTYLQSRNLPLVPLGHLSDDGFLVPRDLISFDVNGGFFTEVYRSHVKSKLSRNPAAYLQLKLSNHNNLNTDLKGQCTEEDGYRTYKLSRVYMYQ